jgi:hypothetical protein
MLLVVIFRTYHATAGGMLLYSTMCICACNHVDNLSFCVKFAMLYLRMQYFMLYRFYVNYDICSFSGADLCVRNFFCVCNIAHI